MKGSLIKRLKEIALSSLVLLLVCGLTNIPALASSHAEAPASSMDRYADNTDVYAFRSTEAGREGFVTIISNFIPFQDPSGGPQFYRFDDTVLYQILIDNTGDGLQDISYQFRFTTTIVNPNTVFGMNTVNQDGVIRSNDDPDYNMPQRYTVTRTERATGRRGRVVAANLLMPPSNIGPRVTPNYETALAQPAVYSMFGGTGTGAGSGRVFAGQRDESFFIDVGGTFDLFNYRQVPVSPTGGIDGLRTFNVNTIAIEVPIAELTRNGRVATGPTDPNAVIGIFSTASRRSTRVLGATPAGQPLPPGDRSDTGGFVQVSRLGSPLINEVVVPLGLKDAFNAILPFTDADVAPVVAAVLDPELPKIIRFALAAYASINITIPPAPRTDIAAIFVTGIRAGDVPNAPTFTTFLSDGRPHEMLRLNTAIPVTPVGSRSRLGLLGNDPGGFPNGRRVFDDVVDIEVRALLGGTPFTPAQNVAPNNTFNDGVSANCEGFLTRFPYLQTPNQGNNPRPANFPATQLFPNPTTPTPTPSGSPSPTPTGSPTPSATPSPTPTPNPLLNPCPAAVQDLGLMDGDELR